MFADLTDENIQPKNFDVEKIPEFEVSELTMNKIKEMFEEEEGLFINFYTHTAVVQRDKNYIFFSLHWLYFAVLCKKYAEALLPYGDFFDNKIKKNNEIMKAFSKENFSHPDFIKLIPDNMDRDRMIKYIIGNSPFRPGKSLINGEKTRATKDIFGSCVLKKLAVPDASSGYLGDLIFYLAKRPELFSKIEEEMNSQLENVKVENKTKKESILINNMEEKIYSIEELGQILSDMYNKPSDSSKVASIHMFGIKYGKVIKEKNYSSASIIGAAGLNESYTTELSKGVKIYEKIRDNDFGVRFFNKDDVVDTIENKLKNCLDVERKPRINKLHPLNLIIYGAPGTGKTYSTAEYALAILDNREVDKFEKNEAERKAVMEKYNDFIRQERIVFTTFHQSYGYEEFIQGLRPDTSSEKMNFKTVDGVFKKIADKALNDLENNYVIIIDEINRANISKVFGELITLIEDDKRWGELNQACVTLQSGDVFAVPNNLYIVGTMNSADKSISLIDVAIRRRFSFVEQKPDASLISNSEMREIFTKINSMLVEQLESSDLLIGHSYFMNKSANDLPNVMNNNIIPLLYEYFYDNKKKVSGILNNSIPTSDYEIVDDKIGRIRIENIRK